MDAMEQVKKVLAVLGKYHFWVLCGMATIVAVAIFATASADLSSRFEERQNDLNGKVEIAQKVLATANPPNEHVIEATRKDIQLAKEDVLQAWEFLYNLQKDQNPWPSELGQEFRAVINSLGPDEEIPVFYRDLYRNFVYNHFPALFKIIDVRQEVLLDESGNVIKEVFQFNTPGIWDDWQDELTAGAYKREVRGKVVWEKPEVLQLGASWSSVPTTFQVRMAQEDLWVYEALLRIIRDTNEGATSFHNAAIKRIDAMHIGKAGSAAFATTPQFLGSFNLLGAAAAATGGGSSYENYGDDDDDDDDDDYGGGGEYYSTAGMDTEASILQGRYVGINGEPLAHDAPQPFAEFKMMPVRLVLLMDQRRIPDLLVNCANSSMPVEVRRVSVRPGHAQTKLDLGAIAAAAGYAAGNAEESYDDDDDDYSGDDDDDDDYGDYGSGGSSGYGRQQLAGGVLEDSMDLPVEIQGVIFIFNPPNREKLGTGSAGKETNQPVAPLTPVRAPSVATPEAGAPLPGTAPTTAPATAPAPAPGGGTGTGGSTPPPGT